MISSIFHCSFLCLLCGHKHHTIRIGILAVLCTSVHHNPKICLPLEERTCRPCTGTPDLLQSRRSHVAPSLAPRTALLPKPVGRSAPLLVRQALPPCKECPPSIEDIKLVTKLSSLCRLTVRRCDGARWVPRVVRGRRPAEGPAEPCGPRAPAAARPRPL